MDRKLNQRVSQFGHSTVFDAIDAFMEFSKSFTGNSGLEFYVSAPIFAAIDRVSINPIDKNISVNARFHQDLSAVKFFAVFRYSPTNTGLLPRATVPLKIEAEEQEGGIRTVLARVQLPAGVESSDYVEVKAVGSLGDIDAYQQQVRALQPSEHINPLYHALAAFRPEAELRQALTSPQAAPIPKSKPWRTQDYFERDVCWLLSCFNFSCVMLGEHETLRVAGSNFQRGSVDILAFHAVRNLMLIVGCTLGTPKDQDFGNITTLQTIFLDEIFAKSDLQIIPVVFTGLKTFQPYWEPSFGEYYARHSVVPVFDAFRIMAALDLIPKKQEGRFFTFLINPQLDDLRVETT